MSSRVEEVALLITEGIKSGHYASGQRLIEADLTKELSISRGPLREALRLLNAQEVIEIIPNRGAIIKKISSDFSLNVLLILKSLGTLAIHHFEMDENFKNKLSEFEQKQFPNMVSFIKCLKEFYLSLAKKEKNDSLCSSINHLNIATFSRHIAEFLNPDNIIETYKSYSAMIQSLSQDNNKQAQREHDKLFTGLLTVK